MRSHLCRPASRVLRVVAVFVVFAVGCSGEGAREEGEVSLVDTMFFVHSELPSDCPMKCLQQAAQFACEGLGLDPTERRNISPRTWQAIVDVFQKESGQKESSISAVPLQELLSRNTVGPMAPVILEHKTGHVYVIIGSIKVGDSLMWQMIHGESPVSLVSEELLSQAGFESVWACEKSENVVVSVGQSTLEVDRLHHNFGDIKPGESLLCSFHLSNTGPKAIVVDKVRTSCSCISTNVKKKAVLEPSRSLDLELTMRVPGSTSLREPAILPLYEKDTGSSKQVSFLILGTHRKLMDISPDHVDFGSVVPRRTYTRTVLLKELPTDRFALLGVEVGTLPLTYEIERRRDSNGLSIHKLDLALSVPEGATSGKTRSVVALNLDGHERQRAHVPVSYEVEPPIKISPSAVSFGTIGIGEEHERILQIIPDDGSSIESVRFQCSPGCAVEVDRGTKPVEITVGVRLKKPGIWIGKITIDVETESGLKQTLEVTGTAYVSEK